MPDRDDPLHELRSRLRDTQEAAEALAGEAASARARQTPPAGWATPEDHAQRTNEVQTIVALLQSLGALIPDDLREQFRDLARQILLLVRAIVDWWTERLGVLPATPQDGPGAPVVQDIPIG